MRKEEIEGEATARIMFSKHCECILLSLSLSCCACVCVCVWTMSYSEINIRETESVQFAFLSSFSSVFVSEVGWFACFCWSNHSNKISFLSFFHYSNFVFVLAMHQHLLIRESHWFADWHLQQTNFFSATSVENLCIAEIRKKNTQSFTSQLRQKSAISFANKNQWNFY